MAQRTIILKVSNGEDAKVREKVRAAIVKVNYTSTSWDKEMFKVVGDIDAANLALRLRRKNVETEIDTVEPPKPKKEEPKKEAKKAEEASQKKEGNDPSNQFNYPVYF